MEDITMIFSAAWSFLSESKVVGVSLIYWFLIPLFVGAIIKFAKGKK